MVRLQSVVLPFFATTVVGKQSMVDSTSIILINTYPISHENRNMAKSYMTHII